MRKLRPVYLFMTKAGRICMATDGPASIYDGPIETLLLHVKKEFNRVYMPGTACNMWLADKIFWVTAGKGELHMLGPRYCDEDDAADDLNRILHNMRRCTAPASVGGWIHVTEHVNVAFQCGLDRTRIVGASLHVRLPFWRDIKFMDYVDTTQLLNLVALIRDPRWFLSADDTTGYKKLSMYLGLTPHNMAAAMGTRHSTRQIRRCHTALRVWQKLGQAAPKGELLPSQFLWEAWRKHENPVLANLRATQAFIEYFVRIWHKRLYPEGHPHAELLFSPQVYFNDEVSAAYKSHLTSVT